MGVEDDATADLGAGDDSASLRTLDVTADLYPCDATAELRLDDATADLQPPTDLPPADRQRPSDLERSADRGAVEKRRPRRRIWSDLWVYAGFLALAIWVTSELWSGAGHRVSAVDPNDQAFFEWMLSNGARVITHFDSPWFTARMNVPTGVNLMANTSILALSIPMAPITLLFGPAVSYTALITLGLAATAGCWYYVLSRHIVSSRWAAAVGGFIAGFGPGIVGHANGHPNLVSQFLLPFIAWRVIRLREPGRWLRNGAALGLLAAVQVFINEELLFITCLGMFLLVAIYAALRPREVRRHLRPMSAGLGVALGIAGALLVYPLWLQFYGPASYHGLNPVIQGYGTNVASVPAFATRTVLGAFVDNTQLAPNPAEQNGFLGWPVLILFAVSIYWVWRNRLALAMAITAALMTVLSFGPKIKFGNAHTTIPGPWALLRHLPLFDSVVPTRLSLCVLPMVAVIVALAHDRVLKVYRDASARPRIAWLGLLGVALVTLIPTPVATQRLAATPDFITDGIWRKYVSADQTVVPVPLPQFDQTAGLFWAANTDLAMQLPQGYFLGPDPSHSDIGIFGAPARHTSTLLAKVITTNKPAVVKALDRKDAVLDLLYWHAGVVVQAPGGPAEHAIRTTLTDLLGFKPTFSGGLFVWDVRKLLASHRPVLG